MPNIAKAVEIAKLNQQLDDYACERRKKASAKEEMEDTLEKLQKKRREIEDGLQETANIISRRLDQLPHKCKFRVAYFEEAKSRFLNPQSSNALDHTREAEKTAKNKLLRLEDEVETLDRNIRNTEELIWQLSQQAN